MTSAAKSTTRSAIEKRDDAPRAHVEELTVAKGASFPPGRMLISSPLELDAVIRRIPEGRVLTVGELRGNLARNHRADYTCPLTTGIFLRIVAEAADEERAAGKQGTAPYWRVVHDDGTLMDKLPGGVAKQARRLAEDGVVLFHLGKVPRVSDVDHYAWHPPLLGKAAGRRPAPAPPKPDRRGQPRKRGQAPGS